MVRTLPFLVAALFHGGAAWASVSAPEGQCDLLGAADAAQPRTADARTLVEISDFGVPNPSGAPSFSFSPDGRKIAVSVRRADIARDNYCVGIVTIDAVGENRPQIVTTGGGLTYPPMHRNGGLSSTISGTPLSLAPSWSPDGLAIAYLRQDGPVTSIWRVGADGGDPRPVASGLTFVEGFRWSADGHSILIDHHPEFAALDGKITVEGQTGFHFDDRFLPASFSRPMTIDAEPATEVALPVPGGGGTGPSLAPSILRGNQDMSGPLDAKTSDDGYKATITDTLSHGTGISPRLSVVAPSGASVVCPDNICGGSFIGFWWNSVGDLLLLKRDGWGRDRTSLYRWHADRWSRVLTTLDWLGSCRPLGTNLVCEHESALHPRTIVRINPANGRVVTVFDPNPGFSGLRLGPVRRLEWRNRSGVPCYGDLVLPPDHRSGQKHPLVIVQYESWGFLRGGTGDAYPIQTLAAHGFAVLSFQRPPDVYIGQHPATPEDALRIDTAGWADRENVLSALETGVRAAEATGMVDDSRIGISGLSDGVATVQYALIHSRMFSVAAISGCCEDETNFPLYGPALTSYYVKGGYPPVGSNDASFWEGISLAENADRITQPILIQAADSEYEAALYTYAALRARDRPIDMYVFPDEHHVRVSPVHRLAGYERAIQWFDFWLQGKRDPKPTDPEQYQRWARMKSGL